MNRSGRVFIPVRFVSEAFKAEVVWDQATRTVTVTYKK
ncbi:copper amine oxidase N-terminal domain-containing protein [bacterium]|nr:copper amine oxidase N-terminal domain-containing protein [bacterium]MCE5222832.1 copper amine oxidase N-terminal domain-containing protein [bacterium]